MIEKEKLVPVAVEGNSMNLAGIQSGDVLYVLRSRVPRGGDVVLASIDGQGTTIKRLKQTRAAGLPGPAWLVPESDDPIWLPIRVDHDVKIVGVVIGRQPAGSGEIEYEIKRRAAVVPFRPAIAAESPGTYQISSPTQTLADYLLEAQSSVSGIGGLEFARSIGLTEAELGDIQGGWIPDGKALVRMAARLGQLTGIRVSAEQLVAFARSGAME